MNVNEVAQLILDEIVKELNEGGSAADIERLANAYNRLLKSYFSPYC